MTRGAGRRNQCCRDALCSGVPGDPGKCENRRLKPENGFRGDIPIGSGADGECECSEHEKTFGLRGGIPPPLSPPLMGACDPHSKTSGLLKLLPFRQSFPTRPPASSIAPGGAQTPASHLAVRSPHGPVWGTFHESNISICCTKPFSGFHRSLPV